MSGRYAKLKADWMLRGWSDRPRALVNWRTSDQRELKKMGLYVAQSCDGRTNFESFAFLPQHHAMLELLMAAGIAEPCRKGDSIEPSQRYRKADNPRLTGIHWCVTGLCNLNCRHCYMQAPSGRYGELPFDQMAALAEQLQRANVIEVSFTGGEPFLRRDILDLIALLTDTRIRLSQIYTNGLLITDRHLEGIRKIGASPAFQVSFDGVGTHDRMRGTSRTEQGVIVAIGRLREARFPVAVATSIDELNIGVLDKTYELMKTLDVQMWRISAPQETGNWRGTKTAASLKEQARACVPLLRRWLKDGRPFFLQLGGLYRGGPARSDSADMPQPRGHAPEDYDCGACREQPNLLPDGTLVPCPGYVDSVLQARLPNLLREDFLEGDALDSRGAPAAPRGLVNPVNNLSKVWTNSFLRRIADMRKKDVLAENPECAACELFKDCGGGCRASALTETGDLMAKDPVTCDVYKKGYKKRFREIAAAGIPRTA